MGYIAFLGLQRHLLWTLLSVLTPVDPVADLNRVYRVLLAISLPYMSHMSSYYHPFKSYDRICMGYMAFLDHQMHLFWTYMSVLTPVDPVADLNRVYRVLLSSSFTNMFHMSSSYHQFKSYDRICMGYMAFLGHRRHMFLTYLSVLTPVDPVPDRNCVYRDLLASSFP